mgnify:CR=1 FL=1
MAQKLKDILSRMELTHLAKIKSTNIKYLQLATDKYKSGPADEAIDRVFNRKKK